MRNCRITDQYQKKGLDVVILENAHLRVEVLAGKGADITEIRDKRTDTNILFEAPHEWRSPAQGPIGGHDDHFRFLDHYPGGWQDVLPGAGGPSTIHGAPLALHGEATLVPWDAIIVEDTVDRVCVRLETSLTRYPLQITRELSLKAGQSSLIVTESVRNQSEVAVDYSWLQHIALGEPLISPEASLSVPCDTVLVDPDHDIPEARFPAGETFEWPICEFDGQEVDLRSFPPKSERVHDLVVLTDLKEGCYTVENPEINLGVNVVFPEDLFEYLWYWQPFGGFTEAPFFGRNYNIGLEPSTSIPNAGLKEAIENGTANCLPGGSTETFTIECTTHSIT
ncbi:aldose 1-epimerase [Haloprofundus halobius]|uniref:aldose 1-epimerase n=1 Tax=Haloprofundus halobius TaxID=2876194 RepID=UPI001CCE3420|nr:aldose 1-epimerase [Haloprofundus halobius]